jgi:hypothetical protein
LESQRAVIADPAATSGWCKPAAFAFTHVRWLSVVH